MSFSALAFDLQESPHYRLFASPFLTCSIIIEIMGIQYMRTSFLLRIVVGLIVMWAQEGTSALSGQLYRLKILFSWMELCTWSLRVILCIVLISRKCSAELSSFLREKSHIGKSEGRLLFCAYDGFMIYTLMLQNFETGEWVLKHTCPGDTIEKHPAAFIPKPHGYKISLRPLTFHPDVDVLFINIQGKIISLLLSLSLYYGLLVDTL